jgi:CRISPR-associated protein Cst2
MTANRTLTHIAGTFVIQADGTFLNGAGLGQGENRNTTIPKMLKDGRNTVPYVSAQAWRRWLRNTLIDETGWPASELRAIDTNEKKGSTNKIAGELNPIDFAEDDLFGYMRAAGKDSVSTDAEDDAEGEEASEDAPAKSVKGAKVKPLMRSSPLATSILAAVRRDGRMSRDEGFVHLKEGTPLPYATEFYVANLQAIFCLDYNRLGVFRNVGDRIELREDLIPPALKGKALTELQNLNDKGAVYTLTDTGQRKIRARALLRALAVLRGGAKQAQFGADVAPKAVIASGLTCGNPIFNHLFDDSAENGLRLKIEVLKEIVNDYHDRIVSPVYIGIRTGFLANEADVRALSAPFVLCTPREAMDKLGDHLT